MATKLVSYSNSQFIGKMILTDQDFVPQLDKLNVFAANRGLKIFITSSARRDDAFISGAVVQPARFSNHLVGHAIDMNIQTSNNFFNSDRLANEASLPSSIRGFINEIRNDPLLRWGGDFNDPVHIDDGLNLRDRATWNAKYPLIQAQLRGLTDPTPTNPRTLRVRQPLMSGDDVKAVQQKLIDLGYDIGTAGVDGFYGNDTAAAVKQFQSDNNVTPIDGIVGRKTRQALGI